jgi:hypothetical protein
MSATEDNMAKPRTAYENHSERYGECVEVTLEDYQTINPDGHFGKTAYGIYEYDDTGKLIEQVAVITTIFEG